MFFNVRSDDKKFPSNDERQNKANDDPITIRFIHDVARKYSEERDRIPAIYSRDCNG